VDQALPVPLRHASSSSGVPTMNHPGPGGSSPPEAEGRDRDPRERPPLVLAPGLDGTGLLFYRQVPLLERRFRVEGHTYRDDRETLDALVADLDERLGRAIAAGGASGERGAVLVGESFGGALVLRYALAHPGRARALVLVGSFPYLRRRARL